MSKWIPSPKTKSIWGIPVVVEDTSLTRRYPCLILPPGRRMKPEGSSNVGTQPPCLSGEPEPDSEHGWPGTHADTLIYDEEYQDGEHTQ